MAPFYIFVVKFFSPLSSTVSLYSTSSKGAAKTALLASAWEDTDNPR